jgi:hypothetical protein
MTGAGHATIVRVPVSLEARAEPGLDAVRSPVTGQPCVYWRLRVVEHLTARSELVHELASSEPFDLVWGRGQKPARVRLDPGSASVEGAPTLHREGTPGALAVARAFGFSGLISVEECVIRPGEQLEVDGILEDASFGAGPFRSVANRLELLDATLRLPSRSLGPVLLPWALGTAAALLGGMGLATWAAFRYHARHMPPGTPAWRTVGSAATRVGAPEPPRPRFP